MPSEFPSVSRRYRNTFMCHSGRVLLGSFCPRDLRAQLYAPGMRGTNRVWTLRLPIGEGRAGGA